jgi:hypothetical protein
MSSDDEIAPARLTTCALCRSTADGPPITWMYERDPRHGGAWYCQSCARDNLRAVEAKLDPQWW